MRTGLEPNNFSDIFPTSKASTESSKSNNWLDLKDESSDEDQSPLRPIQKIEPVVTTLAKKLPIAPIKETPSTVPEPPKKSVFDLLEDDRRALTEKSALTPTVLSNNASQDFGFDDRITANKRPATAGPPKTSLFTDNQQIKSTTKPLFDTKTDYGILKISSRFHLYFSFQEIRCLRIHQKNRYSVLINRFSVVIERIHLLSMFVKEKIKFNNIYFIFF
jgi:hypothetical protein